VNIRNLNAFFSLFYTNVAINVIFGNIFANKGGKKILKLKKYE